MRLRHLHLAGITRYKTAAELQERLVRSALDFKARPLISSPAPEPFVLTAEFHPVYTTGRREVTSISKEQEEFLRAGGKADFHAALRGGQTTFHGPGQLVAYPVLDLKRHGLSPRSYVCLLEQTVINLCASLGVASFRTDNPGVWTTQDDKICALGVHLRRNVTSHGIGLNVTSDPLPWLDRIVACGLEGKRATSLAKEGAKDRTVDEVGHMFVNQLCQALRLDAVENTLDIEVD